MRLATSAVSRVVSCRLRRMTGPLESRGQQPVSMLTVCWPGTGKGLEVRFAACEDRLRRYDRCMRKRWDCRGARQLVTRCGSEDPRPMWSPHAHQVRRMVQRQRGLCSSLLICSSRDCSRISSSLVSMLAHSGVQQQGIRHGVSHSALSTPCDWNLTCSPAGQP